MKKAAEIAIFAWVTLACIPSPDEKGNAKYHVTVRKKGKRSMRTDMKKRVGESGRERERDSTYLKPMDIVG